MQRDWKVSSKNKNCKTAELQLAWQKPLSLIENDEKRLLEKGLFCNDIFSLIHHVIQYHIFFSVDKLTVREHRNTLQIKQEYKAVFKPF